MAKSLPASYDTAIAYQKMEVGRYENIENGRVESVGSSVYLTAYDDINLKISKKSGTLGWRDRPSELSVGDYVFVYDSETDHSSASTLNHYGQ
jgi:hypothetical protein